MINVFVRFGFTILFSIKNFILIRAHPVHLDLRERLDYRDRKEKMGGLVGSDTLVTKVIVVRWVPWELKEMRDLMERLERLGRLEQRVPS